jgi:DNA repair protein RecO (recombination protein O)
MAGMDWTDDAIILHVRPHGETSAVAEVFARGEGRYLGLVRGGRSRKLRPILQTGNLVKAHWRARLSEQLGFFVVELAEPFAARAMDDRTALAAIGVLAVYAGLLPERDPHPGLFDLGVLLLRHLDDFEIWPQLLVRWEVMLLSDLGFGLDLEICAATGVREGLTYVSPKSGRAISAAAGEPYKERLLRLPPFLATSSAAPIPARDLADGLRLTEFFLDRHVFEPRGAKLPEGRITIRHAVEHRLADRPG